MDESIRWLLANGKSDQATKIIVKAAKMNKVDVEKVLMVGSRGGEVW